MRYIRRVVAEAAARTDGQNQWGTWAASSFVYFMLSVLPLNNFHSFWVGSVVRQAEYMSYLVDRGASANIMRKMQDTFEFQWKIHNRKNILLPKIYLPLFAIVCPLLRSGCYMQKRVVCVIKNASGCARNACFFGIEIHSWRQLKCTDTLKSFWIFRQHTKIPFFPPWPAVLCLLAYSSSSPPASMRETNKKKMVEKISILIHSLIIMNVICISWFPSVGM